jgi:protoporphyrinogen oxidase
MTERVDCLIVGAGPTGLGAAWRLDRLRHRDWLLCEATSGAGGLAGSIVDEHGFTWDLGGHVQFSHYQYFDDLMDDLLGPDGWLYHQRESWVWLRGRFVPYPFQLNLHRLDEAAQWACVRGLITAARDARGEAPAHFDEWIARAFGEGIADTFLRPYNWKVWAHPLDSLTWHWIGDRVATVDLPRVIRNIVSKTDDVSWGPNNQFRFPRTGGTGAIWRTLAGRLSAAHPHRLRWNLTLAAIDLAAHQATFADGTRVAYERLLTTMPLERFAGLTDRRESLVPLTAGLRHSSTHVIGIGLDGRPPAHLRGKCWMYFPGGDCPFYRVTVFSHYSPNNVPDIDRYWSLMAEVAESPHKPVDAGTVAADTVQGLVNTCLIADRSAVHHTWHRRLAHGYPTPSRDRDASLAGLRDALERVGVFSRGRFGAWKYEVSNQDHSFAQGVEWVDRMLLGSPETTLEQPEVVNGRRSMPRQLSPSAVMK